MRNWIKSIIFECLKECVKDQPMIIGNRAPCKDDVYSQGTAWVSGNKKWMCIKVTAEWEEIEGK